jgi:protein-S-isoprenylcysteine O-methyltransferase Ste14
MPPSWLLVALQFALIAVLVVTTRRLGTPVSDAGAALLLAAGFAIGLAALAVNRPGNFNIRPEIKPHARLVTRGIYAHIRHPMYSALLLALLGAIVADPRVWRIGVWIALLAVLLVKAAREERYLLARFPDYAAYRKRTRRLIPRLY